MVPLVGGAGNGILTGALDSLGCNVSSPQSNCSLYAARDWKPACTFHRCAHGIMHATKSGTVNIERSAASQLGVRVRATRSARFDPYTDTFQIRSAEQVHLGHRCGCSSRQHPARRDCAGTRAAYARGRVCRCAGVRCASTASLHEPRRPFYPKATHRQQQLQ